VSASLRPQQAVGDCPAGSLDGDREFDYTCTTPGMTPSGYDLCVTFGRRVSFSPEVNDVRDPGRVFIGAAGEPPPSPDPFTILFEFDIEERQSSRELSFAETDIVLRGNVDEAGIFQLNPDQVSLDPLCSIPDEQGQPRVRLTGDGEYSTERFAGSRYEFGEDDDENLEGVQFTDPNVESLDDARRYPDRGVLRLLTRFDNEDAEIETPMEDIDKTTATSRIDVEITVARVEFNFPDEVIDLTVE